MIEKLDFKKRIYIIGSVASGKSKFAKRLSKQNCIPLYEQDSIVQYYNKKRNEYERDEIFNNIICQQSWIIEGVFQEYFLEGLNKADVIIWLDPPTFIVRLRIIKRWIKQRLKFIFSSYTPSFRILLLMFKWNKEYLKNKEYIKNLLVRNEDKIIITKSTNNLLSHFK